MAEKVDLTGIVTVEQSTNQQIIIKKSRFIASVCPVNTTIEAMEFVKQVSTRYQDANHNVYAWMVSGEQEQQKFSDDGEPTGTAGRPVLEVVKKAGLTNVAVVVTRYFGGIMLGAGGLVRAYSEAAQVGLAAAGKRVLLPYQEVWVDCAYDQHKQVSYCAKEVQAQVGQVVYLERVSMQVFVPNEAVDTFSTMIEETASAQFEWGSRVLRTKEE